MNDSHLTQQDEGFDFLRKMWGNVGGFNIPGMVAPTFDVEELEQHINNLKAVEGWLKMNLNMLQMSIQGMEIQRSTLATVKAMTQAHESSEKVTGESLASLFANPAMWAWPFNSMPAQEESTEGVSNSEKSEKTESPSSSNKAKPRKTPAK